MSADSIVSIAWDVLKSYVVVPIKRRFEYVISSKSFAERLRKEVKNLKKEADRVQILEKSATNNVRHFYSPFTDWKASREKDSMEAQELLDAFDEASKTCCYGTLPDPKCRYQFSMKAEAEIKVIRELTEKCNGFKELKDICFIDPSPGDVTAMTSASSASTSIKLGDYDIFESRVQIIREIKDALADNSNSVVGVYGMGGLGKSTLLEEVKRMISEDKSFDWVAKANVSENPDIWTIQGEIADALGLTDIKTKETTTGRAELLQQRLKEESKNRKVLIILDNLWKELDLKSVGIPYRIGNEVMGCKLLLTSRDRKILKSGMGCDKDFLLGELKEDEAKRLFEKLVGDKVHDNKFKPLVDDALHKCAGLPFLIVSMAKYFKGVDLPEWEIALKQIKFSKNKQLGEVINNMMQLSYDHLEDTEKSLLALCVAYGTSKPSFENLVRYGIGWGLFREYDTIEEARGSLRLGIRTLQASSLLLEDGDAYGFKIHDLVREFVASVALRDHPLLVLKDKDKSIIEQSNDKLKSCRAICFPYFDINELPQELDCPELQIFLLFTYSKSLKISDSLFYSMKKLMVLNLTGIHLTCFPSSFQFLESLHTLCLDYCLLDNIAILGELKGLQILSFANSDIHRLPREIGQLAELRLLDLNRCNKLKIIESGVLRSLFKLEELYMKNSFDQWNIVEQTPPTNAGLIELNHMKKLHTLYLSIHSPSMLPEDLNVEKLTKYEIRIGNANYWWHECKGSRTLEFGLDPLSDVLPRGYIQSISSTANCLLLDKFNGCEESICSLSQKGFPKLKHLEVTNSSSIQYILRSPSLTYYETLELLLLDNLITLEKICTNNISSKSFNMLKVVRVQNCNKMEVLFPLSILKGLPQLEEIEVVHCKLMRGIVEVDVCSKVKLHNLHVLKLCNLPAIKNFLDTKSAPSSSTSNDQVSTQIAFFNGQQISMPYLESLTMERLPNIKEIWSDESPFELSNLRSLKVDQCESLSKVIGSRSSVKLHTLFNLCIRHCSSMQEIFDLDGPNANGNVKTLIELTTLELIELESLRCIWNKNPCGIMSLPNLKELKAFNCPNLRFMFFPSMVKSLIQLRDLQIQYCNKMEVIIREEEGLGLETSDTLAFPMLTNLSLNHLASLRCFSRGKCSREAQTQDCDQTHSAALFSREVSFPSLETLYISDMDNIEMIWDSLFEVVFELQPLNPTNGHPVALPLKKLTVSKLPKLKRVWDKKLHHQVKFQCLRSVSIFECKSLASLFPASVARDLIQLEKLEINNCGIVEFIEKEGELVFGFDFPKLTSLQLKHLTKLKCIYTGAHALQWPALKTLEVHGCNKVEILASQLENETPCHKQPLFLVGKGAFPSLQELKLDLSEWMEMWHGHFHDEEFFCKLRVLELRHLSKEYAISTCRFVESLTNLEELVVCESYLEEPTSNVEAIERPSQELKVILPFSRYVRLLKTLNVSRCDGLSSMFTPKIARNLVALTKLRISNCRMLTEVINDEGSKEAHVVAFNHLKCMELDGLVSLKCFSSGGYILMFPLLEDVIVNGCPKMKFFSEGPIEAPKLEQVQVSREAWFWKENLNITIQNMFEEMDTIVGATFVRLSEFPELVGKWHSKLNPVKSSWLLKSLVIDKCPSFVNAIPSKLMPVLDGMRQLQVHNCELLEEIFDLEGLEAMESTQVLPSFSFLSLVNLPKLRQLWNKDLQESLPCNFLTQIALYKCSNLRHVFIPSMASCLANLQWMKIEECGKMEGVIAEEESQVSAVKNITFPKLATMVLECLPNLTSFLLGKNHMLECPNLRQLTIAHCPKMRSLAEQSLMDMNHGAPSLFTPQVQFPHLMLMDFSHMDNVSKIWTDIPQENLTFDYLEEVDVRNCKSLENMFPRWVATSLTQLDTLRVESCGIEEIVTSEDDSPHSNVAQILFPKLISLVLHDMPRLQSFSLNLPSLNWQFLKKLQVTHCDKLNVLSFAASMNSWAQRDGQQDLSDQEAHSLFKRDFPMLHGLSLVDKNIQMIQDGKLPRDIFGKLKTLTLACFHDKNAIFPPRFVLERLQNLQSLEVFCSSFEDIFQDEGLVDEGKHPMLENLRKLKFNKLYNLKRVWREDSLVSKILQSIETFEVCDCPCLTTIFPTVKSFQNLTELVVKNSSGLVHLVTASAVTNLVHLTAMTIIGCERMKEVVANDGDGEGKVISFGKLERFILQHLPSLEYFSSIPSCSFTFPSLWQIGVEECPKMKIFCKGTLSTPKLVEVFLFKYVWSYNRESDDLNTTIQKLSI